MNLDRVAMEYRLAVASHEAINGSLEALERTLFRPSESAGEPGCVVVHLIGNIGDIIVAVPALMALRQRFPAARLVLLSSPGKRGAPGAADLLHRVKYLDGLEIYHQEDITTIAGRLAVAARVRAFEPDLMVFLPSSRVPPATVYRNLLFARMCGVARVFNYRVPSPPFFRLAVARTLRTVPHEVERHLGMLAGLGVARPAQVRFELGEVEPAEAAEINAMLARARSSEGLVFAVCPGGKQAGHLWPVERFAEVARRARDQVGAQVWIVGGPGDRAAAEAIKAVVPAAADFTGKLSILGTARVLAEVDVLLSNDTGPMHLGAAAGTRVVAIFSSQNYAGRWYPWGDRHRVFRAETVCPTCLFNESRTLHCVGRIEVEAVASCCIDMLREAMERADVAGYQGDA
jgi:ADP-heptose:LPS heptosyltransferase